MKLTCLVENTSKDPRLSAEHGLSLYIETKTRKILFDMGQTELFATNAELLGVDLKSVDTAILSHGHHDHGGGLSRFLELNGKAPVYVSRYAFEPHYNAVGKYIGIDSELSKNDRLILTEDFCSLGEGLTLYSCNGKTKEYDIGNFGMTAIHGGRSVPEDFRHEQYLLIEENGKRILISGCSHKGVMDITKWFSPDVLVGGFHFSKFPLDEKLASYAKTLDSFDTEYYTCHCTGTEQYNFMRSHIKKINYLSTGDIVVI